MNLRELHRLIQAYCLNNNSSGQLRIDELMTMTGLPWSVLIDRLVALKLLNYITIDEDDRVYLTVFGLTAGLEEVSRNVRVPEERV